MNHLALVLLLLQPAADASPLLSLQRDQGRALAALKRLDAALPDPGPPGAFRLRVRVGADESDGRLTDGQPNATLLPVRPSSPLDAAIVPTGGDAPPPRVNVVVCRGVDCVTRSWPWVRQPDGGLRVRAPVAELVGDVGAGVELEITVGHGADAQAFQVSLAAR